MSCSAVNNGHGLTSRTEQAAAGAAWYPTPSFRPGYGKVHGNCQRSPGCNRAATTRQRAQTVTTAVSGRRASAILALQSGQRRADVDGLTFLGLSLPIGHGVPNAFRPRHDGVGTCARGASLGCSRSQSAVGAAHPGSRPVSATGRAAIDARESSRLGRSSGQHRRPGPRWARAEVIGTTC